MKITFWGAAQTVTGSMHLCEAGGREYLLDCGQYQGRRKEAEQLNRLLADSDRNSNFHFRAMRPFRNAYTCCTTWIADDTAG